MAIVQTILQIPQVQNSLPNLSYIFQEMTKQGQYGGGDLYRLKKGSTTIYLNLVPTKNQRGTIVVTWLTDPTKG